MFTQRCELFYDAAQKYWERYDVIYNAAILREYDLCTEEVIENFHDSYFAALVNYVDARTCLVRRKLDMEVLQHIEFCLQDIKASSIWVKDWLNFAGTSPDTKKYSSRITDII